MRRVAQSLHETSLHQYRRHQATREGPHLVDRVVHVAAQLAQAPAGSLGMRLHEIAGELELDPERHQPLLSAVVQIAFDARGVRGPRRT